MKVKLIPENDYERAELGIITYEEFGKKMAEKSLKKLSNLGDKNETLYPLK